MEQNGRPCQALWRCAPTRDPSCGSKVVLARENFPLRMMGTVIGGTAMAGSLGMATGPVAGGLIYDAFARYAWLYIGSWAVGLGAFVIALTFRPFAKVAAQPAPAPA